MLHIFATTRYISFSRSCFDAVIFRFFAVAIAFSPAFSPLFAAISFSMVFRLRCFLAMPFSRHALRCRFADFRRRFSPFFASPLLLLMPRTRYRRARYHVKSATRRRLISRQICATDAYDYRLIIDAADYVPRPLRRYHYTRYTALLILLRRRYAIR